ncbi:hypothetical protein [Chroococcidiopsis sp. CCMEE 29]|uniref:hypothetical protein n=1 Tax=Chroococcidiopsis sp. CCMEE 29 TaxID=155894 RepID=UPI00202173EF|nr:hypothetical protein [Chroococcidiopsis sp. CCMEE 29]
MQFQQLELDLWQELEQAAAVPQLADLKQLCTLLEQAIAQLPQSQQLAAAGDAIGQIAQIYARRSQWLISTWEEAHAEADTTLPVLSVEDLDAWVRQTMSIELDAFVQQPASKRQRQKRTQPHLTDSVAGVVEKKTLLEAFDSQIQAADSTNTHDIDSSVDLENVSQWIKAISQWMQPHDGEAVSLLQLQQGLEMPLVDVWLGLLLSQKQHYVWEQRGDFYHEAGELWLSLG